MIDIVLKGLLTGILIPIVILYSLRPKTPYPKWMLVSYENPWILVLALIIALWFMTWDPIIGTLSLIIVLTLTIDYYSLGRRPIKTETDYILDEPELPPVDAPPLVKIDLDESTYPMSPF